MTVVASTAPPLSPKLNLQLSVMMFLQYAIWGAWLPLFFSFAWEFRKIEIADVGILFSLGAVGALAAPFISGQIADRYFNTEKFLGISHIVGAIMVWQLGSIASFGGLVLFGILYSMIYAPTLALTNSLAFHHLPDRDRDFGKVRVWGTVGWIVVGIGMGQWLLHTHTPPEQTAAIEAKAVIEKMSSEDREKTAKAVIAPKLKLTEDELKKETAASLAERAKLSSADVDKLLQDDQTKKTIRWAQVAGMADSFKLSAILGIILGVYCFLLPKTPPKPGQQKFAPWEALAEVKKMPLLALFLISFPVACIHQFYFVHTAGFLGNIKTDLADKINKVFGVGGGGLMTIGQIAELAVLAFMPIVAKKVSRKMLLAVGLVAYILRFAAFAYSDNMLVIGPALALHGLCFGCFFFVAFMIVDEETSPDVRASAQGLYNFVVIGLGTIIGNLFAGYVGKMASASGALSYKTLFTIPMVVGIVCLVALMAIYRGGKKAEPAVA
jgi:MFS family permease